VSVVTHLYKIYDSVRHRSKLLLRWNVHQVYILTLYAVKRLLDRVYRMCMICDK
jgi:hypothetical protein